MAEPAEHLIYFYGTECVHCVEMDEPKKRLEQEHGLKLKELECWHNDENAKLLEKYDRGRCGGIPFMYNTKTEKFICGNCDYDTLKQWALE
ncbi:hypothetical protein GF340_04040 [Candidatus Peregrinibacteria bacterium]|nr:hypothetical protein [Candidatus Peregrinibacteria bacterium]